MVMVAPYARTFAAEAQRRRAFGHRGTEAQREVGVLPARNRDLTEAIIGAGIEVHRELGPGLLEEVYQQCLEHELRIRGIAFERQVPMQVTYKGMILEKAYFADLVVASEVVVELKAVDVVKPVVVAQLLTYMRLLGKRTGLIMNFHEERLVEGVQRVSL